MKKNIVSQKSFQFARQIILIQQELKNENLDYSLRTQLVRSGTAIGALIQEAVMAESKRDFIHKLHIALKEANETKYWLYLFRSTNYLSYASFEKLKANCIELIKLLITIIRTTKERHLSPTKKGP